MRYESKKKKTTIQNGKEIGYKAEQSKFEKKRR